MKNKGITLIALVITIIVLLILAGITISLTIGNQGVITRAQQASKNYKDAEQKEQEELNNFDGEVDNIITGLGTKDKVVGLLPGQRATKTEKNNYNDGTKSATIPEGFTVSGIPEEQHIDSGLVIYDIPENELENIDWKAAGSKEGIKQVQEDYNQYVWIPVNGMNYNYNRYAFLETQPEETGEERIDSVTGSVKIKYNSTEYYFTEAMPTDEKDSVNYYGGYYIGRYEAGIGEGKTARTLKDENLQPNEIEQESGKAISKANKTAYTYVTRNQAKGLAENVYTEKVKSKLCSSYAWDTALKFIEAKNSNYPTNSTGGNYKVESGGTGTLQPTGYHQVSNIYDMGGNCYEWTTEQCSGSTLDCVRCGADCTNSATLNPAAYRVCNSQKDAYNYTGFRVALFINLNS